MAFKPPKQLEEDGCSLIVESKMELMLPPSGNGFPTLKNAHLLKPFITNPTTTTNQHPHKFPSASPPSNPHILDLKNGVHFKGRPKPLKTWKPWVENLQQTHQNLWVNLGIFDAIRASTYQIKRHNELIIGLADKWCPETNTFLFPWGEATITLEDVMILGGFPVLGVSVQTPFESREFGAIEAQLTAVCRDLRREIRNASHYGWMKHFKGKGGELEHVGFLVLWLSRYVFSTNSYNIINPNVFGIAISLVKGVKVALAPTVLAAIYRDLSLLKGKISRFISDPNHHYCDIDLWAPFQILQLWFWERFPTVSPEPTSLMIGEPRLARWYDINKSPTRFLLQEIEAAGSTFLWRPYALPLKNWKFPKFYSENEKWVWVNSEMDKELLSFAWCCRACELTGMDCSVEQYHPYRVGMQFGMDQNIPDHLPRSNIDLNRGWISYDMPLDGWRLYLPPRAANGMVTVKYRDWWKVAMCASSDGPMTNEKPASVVDENLEEYHQETGESPQHQSSMEGKENMEKDHQETGESPQHQSSMAGKENMEEDHQETGESPQHQSSMAGKEAGEAPPDDVVIIEDDDDDSDGNNDRVPQFLALVSGIETRVSNLQKHVAILSQRR